MRIADFLYGAGDDDGFNMSTKRRRGETGGDSVCSSPRSVLSRWLSSLKRVSRESSSSRRRVTALRCEERRDDEWGRERKGNEGEQCSTNGAEGGASSSRLEESARPSVSVGSSGDDCFFFFFFPIVIGFGLDRMVRQYPVGNGVGFADFKTNVEILILICYAMLEYIDKSYILLLDNFEWFFYLGS